jgi:microcystin-dependent protein
MSTPYVGEIRAVGFNFAPVDWAACNGQLLPISEYEVLYTLLGTTYGGDGQNTFALPRLNSRVVVGTGQGPGLSPYPLGTTGGVESVTLTTTQMPAHGHPYSVPLAASTTGTVGNNPAGKLPGTADGTYTGAADGTSLAANAVTATVGVAGGSQPHPNIQPVLALNYIICTNGIYPPPQ